MLSQKGNYFNIRSAKSGNWADCVEHTLQKKYILLLKELKATLWFDKMFSLASICVYTFVCKCVCVCVCTLVLFDDVLMCVLVAVFV